jgi:hypothetical protein
VLTISQLAAYAGVTVRAINAVPVARHLLGLLEERGWAGWTKLRRVSEQASLESGAAAARAGKMEVG